MRWLGLAAIACSACATSYSSATSHRSLGHGLYVITADGNGFTSRSTISEYMYRRAAELCPVGFDLIDSDTSTNSNLATFDGGKTYTTINKPSGALAIACRAPVRPREIATDREAATTRAERKVVTGVRPVYCTAAAHDPNVGACSPIEENCAALFASLTADGGAYTPCAPAKAAACFNATHVLDAVRVTRCAPTITGCEAQLASLKTNPDFEVTAQECGVYRVVQP